MATDFLIETVSWSELYHPAIINLPYLNLLKAWICLDGNVQVKLQVDDDS